MKKQQQSIEVFGRTLMVMTPSGRVFTMREQNGNDDDIISNPITGRDLTNVDNFLTGILISEHVGKEVKQVLLSDVQNFPIKDRFYLLIKSRIFSIGKDMKFTFDWGKDNGGVLNYEEDLEVFIHDYSKPFPQPGDKDYHPNKIPPYPANTDHTSKFEFTTKSGKRLRFGVLTRQGEKYLLTLQPEQMTKNVEFKSRDLQLKTETGEWTTVENFAMFTKQDMSEIRKAVEEVDPTYEFSTFLENPKTGGGINYPLMSSNDFFYPVEI